MELLDFARGDALVFAFAVFAFGSVWRLTALLMSPRLRQFSQPRPGTPGDAEAALRGVLSRFWPHKHYERKVLFNTVNGYVFHIGLAIVVFLYRPHILFFEGIVGFSWPALPNTMVYGIGMVTVISLIAALIKRLTNPVQKLISTADDYISWAITVAPVVTGLWAVNGLFLAYETILAIHILSVCALLIWLPFGKLMHTFIFALSRGASAVRLSRRGATY
jgi:nitrate reductase gamma subunit